MEDKRPDPLELDEAQLEQAADGVHAQNLLFTRGPDKLAPTVQKGPAPKAGGLLHKEVKPTGKPITIEEHQDPIEIYCSPTATDRSCAEGGKSVSQWLESNRG